MVAPAVYRAASRGRLCGHLLLCFPQGVIRPGSLTRLLQEGPPSRQTPGLQPKRAEVLRSKRSGFERMSRILKLILRLWFGCRELGAKSGAHVLQFFWPLRNNTLGGPTSAGSLTFSSLLANEHATWLSALCSGLLVYTFARSHSLHFL